MSERNLGFSHSVFSCRRAALLLLVAGSMVGLDALAMEDIVVSTRKREENKQEVPIAIDVVTGDALDRKGINNVRDLAKFTPGLIFDQGFGPQDTRITVRGLTPARGRQNVAVLVDGIDISSGAILSNGGGLLINPELLDIDRIEFVKGPQNALYGRTAFAGGINYITKKPTEEFASSIFLDVGNHGQREVRGSLSGPLIDQQLFGGLNIAGWNHDGFHDNSETGNEVGGKDGAAISGTLRFEPTDTISVSGRLDYLDDEFDVTPYTAIAPSTPLSVPTSALTSVPPRVPVVGPTVTSINAVTGVLPAGDSLAVTLNPNPLTDGDFRGTERDILRATLDASLEAGGLKFTSLTHYADSEVTQQEDSQRYGSSEPFVAGVFSTHDEVSLFSQELRVQSNDDGPISWVAGALYWDESQDLVDTSFNCVQNPGTIGPPNPGIDCYAPGGTVASVLNGTITNFPGFWSRDTEHWSVYGLVDIPVLEQFSVILEARYTDEETMVVGPTGGINTVDVRTPPFFPLPPGAFPPFIVEPTGSDQGVVKDDFFSPKVTLEWAPNDEALYYFSWADATKPAGISAVTGGSSDFDAEGNTFLSEEMQVFELGAKTSWLDGDLILNGAIFFQDYSDKQVSSQVVDELTGTLRPQPTNASGAEVWGVELEMLLEISENLSLNAGYAWLDTEYDEYEILSSSPGEIAEAGNCTPFLAPNAGPNDEVCRLDLSGNELEGAPDHSLVVGATYADTMSNGLGWSAGVDVSYQSERFVDDFNRLEFDSFTEVNLRAGLEGDNWSFIAYIDNAFDDDTIRSGFPFLYTPGAAPVLGTPFTFVLPGNFVAILPDGRQIGFRWTYRVGGG